eukprot:5403685-Heterocapsa_arctica.AAC.1
MQPSKQHSMGMDRTIGSMTGCFQPVAPRGHSKAISMSVIFWSFWTAMFRIFITRMESTRSFMMCLLVSSPRFSFRYCHVVQAVHGRLTQRKIL